jgi:hypothetical protein
MNHSVRLYDFMSGQEMMNLTLVNSRLAQNVFEKATHVVFTGFGAVDFVHSLHSDVVNFVFEGNVSPQVIACIVLRKRSSEGCQRDLQVLELEEWKASGG